MTSAELKQIENTIEALPVKVYHYGVFLRLAILEGLTDYFDFKGYL